ncbi:MAG: hypothetical protein ACKO5F_13440 [Synechococcus sp.]
MVDVQAMIQTLKALGTQVTASECQQKDLNGAYHPDKDLLLICVNSLPDDDPASLWDVLAHEATHKMQACVGGAIMPPSHVGRMMRELTAIYPEAVEILRAYPSAHSRMELEARWMEMQSPQFVLNALAMACRRG